ncbi:MAG: hypothetical protein EXR59_04895 [Dehalococcoidia bacterium]|nr:hypothetical protein [Dehalococcoidia bacterium]
MPSDIKDILDLCLVRISKGDSINKCLADYSGHEEELKLMLISAVRLYSLQDIRPSATAKARARLRLTQAIAARNAKPHEAPWAFIFARPIGLAILAIALLTSVAGATVAAASDSLPDGTLYPVKRSAESVHLAFTFGDVEKAKLHASYANRRAREMAVMASKQDFNDMEGLQNNLEQHLLDVQKVVSIGSEGGTAKMETIAPVLPEISSNTRAVSIGSSNALMDLRVKLASQGITSVTRIEALIPNATPKQQVLLKNMVSFMRETYSATLSASGSAIPKELRSP